MKAKAVAVLTLPLLVAAGFVLWPKSPATPPPPIAAAKAAVKPAELPSTEVVDLLAAIESGALKVESKGNGRERMRLTLMNKSKAPLAVKVPAGQVFECERNAVVVVRAEGTDVRPGTLSTLTLQTAATRSLNTIGEANYRPTYTTAPRTDAFLAYAQEHLELTPSAIQTAVLALTENLTVSAVARFAPASGPLPSRFNTDAFRVATTDIIQALAALRESGAKDRDLAMTIDPQLKIEAMIEPLCRAAAMRYYEIEPEVEWEYWRGELLNGDPSTRHYALYGIARFYPEIALEMLPRWVREAKTNQVYRLAALQALADTQKPEALGLLHELAAELGPDTELGKAAAGAEKYLDTHLASVAANRTRVAFRSSSK